MKKNKPQQEKNNEETSKKRIYRNEYEKLVLLLLLDNFQNDLKKCKPFLTQYYESLVHNPDIEINKSEKPLINLIKKYKIINKELAYWFFMKYFSNNLRIPELRSDKKIPFALSLHHSGLAITANIPLTATKQEIDDLYKTVGYIRKNLNIDIKKSEHLNLLRDVQLYLEKNNKISFKQLHIEWDGKKYGKFGSEQSMRKAHSRINDLLKDLKDELKKTNISKNIRSTEWFGIIDYSTDIYSLD